MSVQPVDPLNWHVPITDKAGRPTTPFIRQWQNLINLVTQTAAALAAALAASTSVAALALRTISAGTGLTGGGDLTANRTISLADTAVTPATYGDATHVGQFTVDQQGRLTAAADVAIALPASASYGPGYQSGQFYTTPLASHTTRALTANILYAIPFYVSEDTTFTQIGCRVTSLVVSTHIELGIYTNSSGIPGTLEYDSGQVSSATTGDKFLTGLSLVLSAGWHWLVMASDGAPAVEAQNNSSSLMQNFTGHSATNQISPLVSGAWTFSTGALPGSFPSVVYLATSAAPLVFLKL